MPADSVSIRIYSGIARFPCDSMAFLFTVVLTFSAICKVFRDVVNIRYSFLSRKPLITQ